MKKAPFRRKAYNFGAFRRRVDNLRHFASAMPWKVSWGAPTIPSIRKSNYNWNWKISKHQSLKARPPDALILLSIPISLCFLQDNYAWTHFEENLHNYILFIPLPRSWLIILMTNWFLRPSPLHTAHLIETPECKFFRLYNCFLPFFLFPLFTLFHFF